MLDLLVVALLRIVIELTFLPSERTRLTRYDIFAWFGLVAILSGDQVRVLVGGCLLRLEDEAR